MGKVLETLREHRLYAKRSKCYFGQRNMEYLGYIITPERMATDPKKIEDGELADTNFP